MTNKELAVQLYIASIQANATIMTSPNYSGGKVKIPTPENMVESVKELTSLLATIDNN